MTTASGNGPALRLLKFSNKAKVVPASERETALQARIDRVRRMSAHQSDPSYYTLLDIFDTVLSQFDGQPKSTGGVR